MRPPTERPPGTRLVAASQGRDDDAPTVRRPRAGYSAGVLTYTIGQAAALLGVSAETVRRWADGGQLVMDRGGSRNRLIDGRSLAAFAKERAAGLHPVPGQVTTSVRNSFAGIVTAVTLDDVVAQVEIQSGPHRLVSLVTREAVEELRIEVGSTVTARVKSTNVHVDRPQTGRADRPQADRADRPDRPDR